MAAPQAFSQGHTKITKDAKITKGVSPEGPPPLVSFAPFVIFV
jgi:hypothetical protein